MAKQTTTEVTGDHVDALSSEVAALRDEVRVLRDVLAELVEDVQWAIRNSVVPTDMPPDRFRLTSMPADPCVEDFHERVNAISPPDVLGNVIDSNADNHSDCQQTLWSDEQ